MFVVCRLFVAVVGCCFVGVCCLSVVVDGCSLFVVRCVCIVVAVCCLVCVRCSLFVVSCVSVLGRRALSVDWCVLFACCYVLFVDCWLLCDV